MFRGKDIDQLKNQISKLEEDFTKVESLSKQLTDAKTHISQIITDVEEITNISKTLSLIREKIDSIEDNYKSHETRLLNQEKKIQDLISINDSKSIDFKDEMISVNNKFDDFMSKTDQRLIEIGSKAEEASTIVAGMKEELEQSKRNLVIKEEQTVQLETLVKEKSERITNLENTLAKLRSEVGKLELQNETMIKEADETRYKRDDFQKQYIEVSKELNEYRSKTEPSLILNSHVKQILAETEMGKILLQLQKVNEPISFEELSEKVNMAVVVLKRTVYAMQDFKIVKIDEENRLVSLS